jgi:hypothetical protein
MSRSGQDAINPTPEDVGQLKADTTAPAQEVLEHVHRAILAIPEFTLKDGTKAKVTDLAPPQANDDGDMQCGFDVELANGSHLEFYLKNTGWGRPFTALAPQTPRRHRAR